MAGGPLQAPVFIDSFHVFPCHLGMDAVSGRCQGVRPIRSGASQRSDFATTLGRPNSTGVSSDALSTTVSPCRSVTRTDVQPSPERGPPALAVGEVEDARIERDLMDLAHAEGVRRRLTRPHRLGQALRGPQAHPRRLGHEWPALRRTQTVRCGSVGVNRTGSRAGPAVWFWTSSRLAGGHRRRPGDDRVARQRPVRYMQLGLCGPPMDPLAGGSLVQWLWGDDWEGDRGCAAGGRCGRAPPRHRGDDR